MLKSGRQIRKVSRPAVVMRQDSIFTFYQATLSHTTEARAPSSTYPTLGYSRIAIFSIHPYAFCFRNNHGIIENCDPSLFTGPH